MPAAIADGSIIALRWRLFRLRPQVQSRSGRNPRSLPTSLRRTSNRRRIVPRRREHASFSYRSGNFRLLRVNRTMPEDYDRKERRARVERYRILAQGTTDPIAARPAEHRRLACRRLCRRSAAQYRRAARDPAIGRRRSQRNGCNGNPRSKRGCRARQCRASLRR
jgi:hypothetical protein